MKTISTSICTRVSRAAGQAQRKCGDSADVPTSGKRVSRARKARAFVSNTKVLNLWIRLSLGTLQH